MAGQKRTRPNDAAGGSGRNNGGGPSATVYRKSAKKARSDQQEAAKPAKKPVPQRTRPKDEPKPKTKHEFIQAKKAAALKEKEAAAAARRAEEAAEKQLRKKQTQQQKGKSGSSKGAPQQPATILIKPPRPTSTFKVVAGSYERLLYGLKATVEAASSEQDASTSSSSKAASSSFNVSLKPIFTFPAHISSIRTVATAGADSKWLATGGTDEIVKVWDLRKQREVGQLTGHEGTITSLVFASRTYLLTTSADSNINLYRTRDWALLRTLKGHIGRINSASPHPTGRLALSVGSDRTIRMWDLMRGQAAASTRIGIEADLVKWDTLGSRFCVLAYRQAMIFKTDMTKVAELEEKRRIGDVCFFRVRDGAGKERELLFAGLEDGVVKVFDLDADVAEEEKVEKVKTASTEEDSSDDEEEEEDLATLVQVGRLVGHKNRVRSIAVLPVSVWSGKGKQKAQDKAQSYVAITISSDGFIRTFDLSAIVNSLSSQERSLAEYAERVVSVESNAQFDTKGTRLTCLTAVGVAGNVSAEQEEEEEDVDVLGSDEDEEAVSLQGEDDSEDEDVDEEAEDEELKALERALKEAQEKGLDLEDLAGLLNEDSDDEEAEEEEEEEDEGELE
ncbi:related to MAK11 protein (maintenance of killer toxin-encoding satellite M1 dsRNA) [Ustilago trichophora]|uniref:Related to MAK11 protein (Maintenance of killer toxin-encoding satellite M1 dsRNA) n=1 Tax=Ustilago trichophora TaxID=86804 RepID=A0A5C3EFC3_9BASI|nr:related to MAK11 protein (maintenance of killer toxin-encoding satellite M1 dsRNA) [Ustilago trichophora]